MADIPQECWAIAAGDTDRNYADLCLKHGVILMGPGNPGSLLDIKEIKNYEGRYTPKMLSGLKRFVGIQPGHLIVLRLGKSEVHGVGYTLDYPGTLPGLRSYGHSEFFADVDGWDLQHFHYVHWIWRAPNGIPKRFPHALNMGDTAQKLKEGNKNRTLFDWIRSLKPDVPESVTSHLVAGKKLEVRDITTKLFDYGLGSGAISSVEERISDLCRLAEWYKKHKLNPSENETVSHLVTPLLLSLGWTPQRIALEYPLKGGGRIDLALFPNGNRDYEPIAIVEAKKLGQSCLSASEQVKKYASQLKSIRQLIVTDGIRYGLFLKRGNQVDFSNHPVAYMNLTKLHDAYPVYGADCGGADEVILALSAAWSPDFVAPNTRMDI